jgi:ABC-type nickel/cobalt efflux system permease component RcnA
MKCSFFNWRGAEFSMYVLVLLLTILNGVVFLQSWCATSQYWYIYVPALFVLVPVIGIWWYRKYLRSKQDKFPIESPFIMHNEDAPLAVNAKEQKGTE